MKRLTPPITFVLNWMPDASLAKLPQRLPDWHVEVFAAVDDLLHRAHAMAPQTVLLCVADNTTSAQLQTARPIIARWPVAALCADASLAQIQHLIALGVRSIVPTALNIDGIRLALHELRATDDDGIPTVLVVGATTETLPPGIRAWARIEQCVDLAAAWSQLQSHDVDTVWFAPQLTAAHSAELAHMLTAVPALSGIPVVYQTTCYIGGVEHTLSSPDDIALLWRLTRTWRTRSQRFDDHWRDSLRAQQRLFDVVNEHALVSVADARGNIVYANGQFCAVSGYSVEELIGQNHRIIKSDRHEPAFYRELWQAISTGQVWRGEIANRRKDGSLYWVHSTIAPWTPIGEQQSNHYISIRTDVTRLKDATDLLHGLRAALVKLATAVPPQRICMDMLELALAMTRSAAGFILSVHGTLDDATAAVRPLAMYGLSWVAGDLRSHADASQTMLGCECDNQALPAVPVWGAPDAPFDDRTIRSWFETSQPLGHLMLMPIYHANTLMGIAGFSCAGTPYDRAAAAFLDPYAATLGAIIRAIDTVAYDALVRRELLAAKVAAEEANHAKSMFLSNMSHELRTPLNVMLGFAQLLDLDPQHPLAEKQRQHIGEILKAGQHLLGLINDILDVAKIEAGQIKVKREVVDVAPVVADVIRLLEPLFKSRDITVQMEMLGDHWPWVEADPTRLRQVLLNLLSNATKYNAYGGSIRVSMARVSERRVRLSVTDTGAGIPEEKFSDLFRPFSRLEPDITGQEGTGIGLFVTRQLAELMEGRVGVYSTVGVGSTFWVELKTAQAPTPEFEV